MLSLFKADPKKKLHKQYEQKLEQAMHAQRRGDIKSYSFLMNDADKLWQEISKLEAET
ncbi:MAG: hypothetical protein C9356_10970 [Oleiphilus sp.]|nr:MAG: hypothetical protein C9356_10970 [Oleiphilus sp.]